VNTWKAILAALVIFGTGVVTGAVWLKISEGARAGSSSVTHTPANGAANGNTTTPGRPQSLPLEQLRRVELMMHAQKELNLTPVQREHIEKIIGDGQDRIRDLWDQVAPDIFDEFQDVKQKVCAELTQEQNKRFDELMKQHPHKPAASTNAPTIKVSGDGR
jgi:hypothetical protein